MKNYVLDSVKYDNLTISECYLPSRISRIILRTTEQTTKTYFPKCLDLNTRHHEHR